MWLLWSAYLRPVQHGAPQVSALTDHEILAASAGPDPLITPCAPALVRTSIQGLPVAPKWIPFTIADYRVISYGPSSAGYDIRASDVWWQFRRPKWWTRAWRALVGWRVRDCIDPKAFDPGVHMHRGELVSTPQGMAYLMPPHSYALTHSVEAFNMPPDVLGICVGKSTYARCGLVVNVTPLEPGWRGVLVVEVANTTPRPLLVYVNEGIAQIVFFRLPTLPSTTYASRQGKYQGQTGLTFAKA